MKKLFVILLTVVMVTSLCACASESTGETKPLKEHTPASLFIHMGYEITIEDQKITADAFGRGGSFGDFYVNRLTGEIVIIEDISKYSLAISTGLYWPEDTIETDGYIIPILHLQNAE